MKTVKIFHILIEGRVQGVGYRRFAALKAEALGLTGSARNLLDGRVEIYIATGESAQFELYLKELWRGPVFGKVREVKSQELNPPFENPIHKEWVVSHDQSQFVILPDEDISK